jgi:hypothetical protein
VKALFVSLVIEMKKKGLDITQKFAISQILIPKGTAVKNPSTYGFSILSMLSGQKQREFIG